MGLPQAANDPEMEDRVKSTQHRKRLVAAPRGKHPEGRLSDERTDSEHEMRGKLKSVVQPVCTQKQKPVGSKKRIDPAADSDDSDTVVARYNEWSKGQAEVRFAQKQITASTRTDNAHRRTDGTNRRDRKSKQRDAAELTVKSRARRTSAGKHDGSDSDGKYDDGRDNRERRHRRSSTSSDRSKDRQPHGGGRGDPDPSSSGSDGGDDRRDRRRHRSRSPHGRRHHKKHKHRSSSNKYSSDSRGNNPLKPLTYNGETDLDTFLTQFEIMSDLKRFSERERAGVIKHSLRGRAAQILMESGPQSRYWTFDDTVEKLRARFGHQNLKEKYAEEMRNIRRSPNESIPVLEARFRAALTRAFGPIWEKQESGQFNAIQCFLKALANTELELRIRDRGPTTLDEAVQLANRLEANALATLGTASTEHRNSVRKTNLKQSKAKTKSSSDEGEQSPDNCSSIATKTRRGGKGKGKGTKKVSPPTQSMQRLLQS
jgi:hypothetical protein